MIRLSLSFFKFFEVYHINNSGAQQKVTLKYGKQSYTGENEIYHENLFTEL
jgi:hypothetical protein